ncbi:hypothetical protein SEA_WHEELBITE_51 [Arthrobacter phage Wheelbite]|uniref:Uncharacterized protein n=1 Tax=Arthrobacter phage Wheelbite TaxID=2015873 RepID=A0A222ZIP1_9CAUD|nr:hypothetical protein KMD23_gp51 [Arthrobacter phage Wheelbite]ASR84142.1 hypothetical protein SEA_WHEELBITE_51 [Arthrobacter phage Wheelbite]
MQINIHELTLTTKYTATIKINGSDDSIKNYPKAVLYTMATVEALDITGFEWEGAEASWTGTNQWTVFLNKA